jgi:hypothetical protein
LMTAYMGNDSTRLTESGAFYKPGGG